MRPDTTFHDQLTPLCHLIHQAWNGNIVLQGRRHSPLIKRERPGRRRMLDVACGCGTRTLALARLGCPVTASDLSSAEVARAKLEAVRRKHQMPLSTCDMRHACTHHGGEFDTAVCAKLAS